ncbi:MAG TPA: 2-oxoacid:ferredoxin oxidoreductase subunit beta [Thermodesulfobacteriota bacterium]|nr:2-oxoacid:ferredoxin oxidoreductase subunit beta [Thermodesulfobacteriota bacterium]
MVDIKEYGDSKPAWCPGCGNFPLLKAVKQALVKRGLEPHQVLFIAGIGQAAKTPHYLKANLFNGLHGRCLPVATGAKLANPDLVVIAESGDGCMYSEGGNHFLAAIRRNIDITVLVHNNQVYGLTKGQASPTSDEGFTTKAQPEGVALAPFNPLAVAIALHAGFVGRGYVGLEDDLVHLLVQAINHRGFSLVDILQPCVSFNRVNTYQWYKDRCKPLSSSHDPTDWEAAMRLSQQWGEEIPVGVIYRNSRPPFEDHIATLKKGPLVAQTVDRARLAKVMETYG